jgi:hypothetical protein
MIRTKLWLSTSAFRSTNRRSGCRRVLGSLFLFEAIGYVLLPCVRMSPETWRFTTVSEYLAPWYTMACNAERHCLAHFFGCTVLDFQGAQLKLS